MGFFSNLFRGRSTKRPDEDEVTLPARMEFKPGLTLRIDSHPDTPSGVALWSFVSDGLRAHGQREIVITILRRRGEPEHAFPRQVLVLFRTIYRFAREGRIVVPGHLTEFGLRASSSRACARWSTPMPSRSRASSCRMARSPRS